VCKHSFFYFYICLTYIRKKYTIIHSGGLILDEKGQVLYENGMNYKQTEEVITFIKEKKFDCTIQENSIQIILRLLFYLL